jgi:hypothetical protein
MKNTIIVLAIATAALAACNNGNNKTTDIKQSDVQNDTSKVTPQPATTDATGNTAVFSVKEIIAGN